MALIFILHVLAIGILINRLPLRFVTIAGTFVYFTVFYLYFGHYLASHRERFVPQIPLEDDYYRFRKPKKISPFDPPTDPDSEMVRAEKAREKEEDDAMELERLERKQNLLDQTRTKP